MVSQWLFLLWIAACPADASAMKHEIQVMAINAKVALETVDFKPENHGLLQDGQRLERIDGAEFHGTDGSEGSLPLREPLTLRVSIGNQCFSFPEASYKLLFDLDPRSLELKPDRVNPKILLLSASGGGKTFAYQVQWQLDTEKRALTRTLTAAGSGQNPAKTQTESFPALPCDTP